VGWALADDLGLVEEVGGQDGAGVEDLDADELAVVLVECDECVKARRWPGAGRDLTIGRRRLAAGVPGRWAGFFGWSSACGLGTVRLT
jgi:hypothetical protein